MANPKIVFSRLLILINIIIWLPALKASSLTPPPANDNCANALPIPISAGGFDFGTFISETSDLSMATAQAGEYFAESGHTRSVWYQFAVPTHRSLSVDMGGNNLENVAVTVYSPTNCLPSSAFLTGTLLANGGGDITNSCSEIGIYRVQVTGPANTVGSVFIILTLDCPTSADALYDCPTGAHVFNGGNPIGQGQVSTGTHSIACQSVEVSSESNCLPVTDRADFLKTSWYVFTTGNSVDLLIFYFGIGSDTERAGYRVFEGNVRNSPPGMLPLIECGMAIHDNHTRHIELACVLQPNTTYSIALHFHEDFERMINLSAQQRGESATGWPRPVLPPVLATNQLGILPESVNGTTTTWVDRFDCSSYIIDNVCPPANPNSGIVIIGTGANTRRYDLTTWATFTIAEDVDVTLTLTSGILWGEFHTRIFNTTLDADCPSPNPAGSDLYFQFSGRTAEIKCMPPGDYSIQVLTSSVEPNTTNADYDEAWTFGCLGTQFNLALRVFALPSIGLFRLDEPGNVDSINMMNALQEDVLYPSVPAVFICDNTAIPENGECPDVEKAMYRQALIGDSNMDGIVDSGLLTITRLRTDDRMPERVVYSFNEGDANQLASAAGTHDAGEEIPGLTDYAGFCIDEDDDTEPSNGIDRFCVCVTPGTYTLATLGTENHVGVGDEPGFRFNTYKTIYDSRENVDLITVINIPDTLASNLDVFSCLDNLGTMPPCGRREKLIYREFYLPSPALVTIVDAGSSNAVISLFSGQASDLAADLELISDCAGSFVQLYDPCNPLPEGWYTIVSYGEGPNYTDTRVWNFNTASPTVYMGDPRDVGKTSRIVLIVEPPVTPNYNRPEKAYQAGITDWITPPVSSPNNSTWRIHGFAPDTFCLPDTPFIPQGLIPCTPEYNRVAFYVFEITKPSFVQIRNVNPSFYTEVFPFDVTANPGSLLTVPPVYQCFAENSDYRQLCDLPPGIYTIAIFANDDHEGASINPSIYVEAAALSRFDHVWNAYDFDQIPHTNMFVDGKLNDVSPIPNQPPSRDVFYCTTGATINDPQHTRCNTQLNPLIYAQPDGVPKPLFLPGEPAAPLLQPWRNLWYTFELSGTGTCTIQPNILGGINWRPLIAIYESNVDASIPWSTLQADLMSPQSTIVSDLRLITESVDILCDSEAGDIVFRKNGCLRDSVRYFVVVSFDAHNNFSPPNLPNQTVSLSISYDAKPTYTADYDERTIANVINGLVETAPPYTSQPLAPGNTFVSTDFSLQCYTSNVTDPWTGLPCLQTAKSAWFKFEVSASGQIFTALEKLIAPGGWTFNAADISLWREASPNAPLTEQAELTPIFVDADQHAWLKSCVDPGTYFLMIRHCSFSIDTSEIYRVVVKLTDTPGDFCSNAITMAVPDFVPVTGTVIPDCHTIGTDYGEQSNAGMGCLYEPIPQKTSWFHVSVSAAPEMDITFELSKELGMVDFDQLSYRIFVGSCGALTPIACSSIGSNIITQRCLAPGDYYIQIAMPDKDGNESVAGTIDLTVTASLNSDPDCIPVDHTQPLADFTYTDDCETIYFNNFSTGGTDISYLWQFPDGTSTESNPIWTPSTGLGTYPITLIVTNNALNTTSSVTINVTLGNALANYVPLSDTTICNNEGPLTIDATVTTSGTVTYQWENTTTNPIRMINAAGSYWIRITADGCEIRDTLMVSAVNAQRNISTTICPDESIIVAGEMFDINNPSGIITIPGAHQSGCDSILMVNLNFYTPSGSQFSETICDGDTYFFGGENLAVAGNYNDTLNSQSGCDSVVTLILVVTPQETHQHDIAGCLGESITLQSAVSGSSYLWDSGPLTETLVVDIAGSYIVSVSNDLGCIISIEYFNVTFGLLTTPVAASPDPVCPGKEVTVMASGSPYDYRWFDAATGGNLLGTGSTLLLTDIFNDTIVYVEAFHSTIDGCVSLREPVLITVTDDMVQVVSSDTLICEGNAIELPWGDIVMPDVNSSYSHTWPSAVNGCDSLFLTVNVDIENSPSVFLPAIHKLFLGDSVRLIPELDFQPDSIEWSPALGLSCTDCLRPWANPLVNTDYTLTLWTIEGCITTAIVRIEVDNDVNIYFPNVFSPNGDNVNDKFTVSSRRNQVRVRSLIIYDRWGGALWEGTDFLADGTHGWDGYSRGQAAATGVYVWKCEVEMLDGSHKVFSGDVTLVR
jgi:gliding motility-associated-like protein